MVIVMKAILFLALLFLAVSTANAKLYQYTDADGNVHFTDTPPIDAQVEERKVKGGQPSADSVEKLHAEREARAKAKEEQAKAAIVAEQEAKNQEIRKKNCEIAREQQRFYKDNEGRRIRAKNEDGTYVFKTPEETAKATEEARKLVEEWCN